MADTSPFALPPPRLDSEQSVEAALAARRSVRRFAEQPLSLAELAQLLWAAQGVTHPAGFRTAPSAGATYPLETFAVVGAVEGLEAGIYRYHPDEHALSLVRSGDRRDDLRRDAHSQAALALAPVTIVLAAVFERIVGRYRERSERYIHLEVGHAAENVALQAIALGLGSVMIGAFRDEQVEHVVGMTPDERAMYMVAVGRP